MTTAGLSLSRPGPRPPSYRGHFLFGAGPELVRDPLELVSRLTHQGGVTRLRVGPWVGYVVAELEAVGHVLVGGAKNFGKGTASYRALGLVLGQGLVTSDGDFWMRQRRTIAPAFHRQRVFGFGATMTAATQGLLDEWAPALEAGAVLDVHREMMKLTLRIVCRTLLSVNVAEVENEIGDALSVANAYTYRLSRTPFHLPRWFPSPLHRRFRRAMALLDRVVLGAISERRQDGAGKGDLLDLLMAARDEETGEGMGDRQLRDEVMTLFTAGHETTANGLTFTLWLLARHPEVQRAVRAELQGVLGERSPGVEDLPRLSLLERVVKEALRLCPPVWAVDRSPHAPEMLGGHRVKPGEFVLISPWALHRDPRYWDEPETFDPDRFLPEAEARRPRHAYLPFLAGNRKCIGDVFAMTELRLALATLLSRVEVAEVPGEKVTLSPEVTLRPKGPLRLGLRRAR